MKLADKIKKHLDCTPNKMDSDWNILFAVFPKARYGDKYNGGRIVSIRKESRKKEVFFILPVEADIIALERK